MNARTIIRIEVGLPAGAPINLISESGRYKLVMRSDKPLAVAFQDFGGPAGDPHVRH